MTTFETRRAASWLYHSEPVDLVLAEFPNANLRLARKLCKFFESRNLDFDKVHFWSFEKG